MEEAEPTETFIHERDFDDCDALLDPRIGEGWQPFFHTADIQVRRRALDGSSLSEFRLDGTFPTPAALFFEVLTTAEYRATYDKFTARLRTLRTLEAQGTDIVHWRLRLPLLAERDYVYARKAKLDLGAPGGAAYRLVSLATPRGAFAPTEPGVVRVERYVSKCLIRALGPERCAVHLHASQDLKGTVPSMVLDFFASTGLAALVGSHRRACAAYPAWRAAHRGPLTRVTVLQESSAAGGGGGGGGAAEARAGAGEEGLGAGGETLATPRTAPPRGAADGAGHHRTGSDPTAALGARAAAPGGGAADGGGGGGGGGASSDFGRLHAGGGHARAGSGRMSSALLERLRTSVAVVASAAAEGGAGVAAAASGAALSASRAVAAPKLPPAGAEAAAGVTSDYLALLRGEPVRLTEERPPPSSPPQLPPPPPGGEGGGRPDGAAAATASTATSGGAQWWHAPAHECTSLSQLRLGVAYRTQRGSLVRRVGLRAALLDGRIEMAIADEAGAARRRHSGPSAQGGAACAAPAATAAAAGGAEPQQREGGAAAAAAPAGAAAGGGAEAASARRASTPAGALGAAPPAPPAPRSLAAAPPPALESASARAAPDAAAACADAAACACTDSAPRASPPLRAHHSCQRCGALAGGGADAARGGGGGGDAAATPALAAAARGVRLGGARLLRAVEAGAASLPESRAKRAAAAAVSAIADAAGGGARGAAAGARGGAHGAFPHPPAAPASPRAAADAAAQLAVDTCEARVSRAEAAVQAEFGARRRAVAAHELCARRLAALEGRAADAELETLAARHEMGALAKQLGALEAEGPRRLAARRRAADAAEAERRRLDALAAARAHAAHNAPPPRAPHARDGYDLNLTLLERLSQQMGI